MKRLRPPPWAAWTGVAMMFAGMATYDFKTGHVPDAIVETFLAWAWTAIARREWKGY